MASAKLALLLLLALPSAATAATLGIGLTDGPGGAKALRKSAQFTYRYQYLAGGVNTGDGWPTWNPNGSFVTRSVERRFVSPRYETSPSCVTIVSNVVGQSSSVPCSSPMTLRSVLGLITNQGAVAMLALRAPGAARRDQVIDGLLKREAMLEPGQRAQAMVANGLSRDLLCGKLCDVIEK